MENEFSEHHISKQKELFSKYFNVLNKNKKDLDIFERTLLFICSNSIEYFSLDLDLIPINHQENILIHIMEMGSEHSTRLLLTKNDFSNVLDKFRVLECVTNNVILNMQKGIKKKVTLPKILASKLLEQFETFKKNKSYLNRKIQVKLDINFNKEVENIVLPCLDKIIKFLKEEYIKNCRNSIGLSSVTNGKKMYKYLIKNTLQIDEYSIREIHNYGIKEVERIYNEMIEIKNHYGYKGNLKDFHRKLLTNDKLKFKNSKEIVKTYVDEIKNINKSIIKSQFYNKVKEINCKVKEVPMYNQDFSSEAYYIHGSIDNKRKGTFYINTKYIKNMNKIDVESLTLHEANPGHHYQQTYVLESKNIPLFLKYYGSDSYAEGWALYCERLGEYKDKISYFGKLILEMIRALRLVVDTGIHYYNWSFEKTFNYYKKYSFDSDSRINNQILRYIAIPTQALSYKIGEKVILECLEAEKKNKKEKFNIKKFHDKILEDGPVPLFLLKEKFFD